MTGIPETDMRRILKKGIARGTLKEVSPDVFEMTESGMFVTRKIIDRGYQRGYQREAGNWKCTKCQTINNMLNGSKCLKCDYSFEDNLASEIFKREKENFKYPKVTEKETLIFLLGQLTGFGMVLSYPRNIPMMHKINLNEDISEILSLVTKQIKKQFTTISDEEFDEIMIQLNAVRTIPMMSEALEKLRKDLDNM